MGEILYNGFTMRMRKKKWALPFIEAHRDLIIDLNENTSCLDETIDILEIGCGKGDFIVGYALKHPQSTCVAVEKDPNAIAVCGKKVVEAGLSNVRLYCGDGKYLPNVIQSDTITTIFLNHSDPWPKKHHARRRLTHEDFARLYRTWLKPEGTVVQKTDNAHFFDYSLVSMSHHGFELAQVWVNYQIGDDNDDVPSEYEMKFRGLNQPIYRAIYQVVKP